MDIVPDRARMQQVRNYNAAPPGSREESVNQQILDSKSSFGIIDRTVYDVGGLLLLLDESGRGFPDGRRGREKYTLKAVKSPSEGLPLESLVEHYRLVQEYALLGPGEAADDFEPLGIMRELYKTGETETSEVFWDGIRGYGCEFDHRKVDIVEIDDEREDELRSQGAIEGSLTLFEELFDAENDWRRRSGS